MTNKVLLASRRSLRSWVKNDHCMIKFPLISNVSSKFLIQGRWKIPYLKCTFTETDSSSASDFQTGQCSQCCGFPNELRSWWCYPSPVHNHLSQTPLSYTTVPCLHLASDWLSAFWQPVSEMHLLSYFRACWGGPRGKALAGCVPMPQPVHCQWRVAVSACREEEKMLMALWLVQEKAAFCCWVPFDGWFWWGEV